MKSPSRFHWSSPPLATALLLAACGAEPPRPNALLVTLDTTRADAVGAFGGPAGVTPRLDRLAAEGTAYTSARTVTPITLPAHVSMFTGLYPPRHGIRDNELWSLSAEADTLAERAAAAGYETAGFVAAPVLDRAFGIAQGFEVWHQPDRALLDQHAAEGHTASLPAETMVALVLEWLEQRDPDRPFLAWVHFYDPHLPLAPPAPFVRQAGGNPYLAEVARVDHAVGRLLDALERRGQLERTAVVVVGDHGEGNGDHGEATHGTLVFDTTLRVPLVVRAQAAARGPARREDLPVSVVDVGPTLAALLGLDFAPGADGRELLSPLPPERGVYFESYHGYLHFGWSPLAGWVDARGKYVHSSNPQLFEPHADPGERRDRIASASASRLARYRDPLANITAGGVLETAAAAADRELVERIRALGYVEAGGFDLLPPPLEELALPSPHDSIAELDAVGRAADRARAGDQPGALALYREVLAGNPLNSTARAGVAFSLYGLDRFPEAVAAFEELLASAPETALYHATLAACLEATGESERALLHYERAAEIDAGDVATLRALARLLHRAGQVERADQVRERIRLLSE